MKFLTTDYGAMLETLVRLEMDFELRMSTYTTIITVSRKKYTFLQNYHNKATFAQYQKMKAYLKNIRPPKVSRNDLVYYNQSFRHGGYYGNVTNIDLKSAYVSVLYNEGLLTTKLYNEAKKLSKDDRLACVGMLAARSECFVFKKGRPVSSSVERSAYENFFFHAVDKTSKIIEGCRRHVAPNFLFSWVDGFYFEPDDQKQKRVCTYLDSLNLPYTVENLTDFMASVGDTSTRVSFFKDGVKQKRFNIPNGTSQMRQLIYNYLLTQKHKDYVREPSSEKSKIKSSFQLS